MKTVNAAIVAASALLLLLTPLQLAAKAAPHALHAHHFFAHLHQGHHHRAYGAYGAYGAWPLYGDIPSYTVDAGMSSALPAQIIYVPERPAALGCHHSEQTVTVPAEAGGTRQVTVTRC